MNSIPSVFWQGGENKQQKKKKKPNKKNQHWESVGMASQLLAGF